MIENKNWDFVGVSFTTNQRKFLWKLTEITDLKDTFLIGGGVHPTLDKQNTFKEFPEFDAICIGEGEMALQELCKRIDKKQNLTDSPSFIFKVKDDTGKTSFKVNPTFELKHIDDLEDPDYTIFDYKRIVEDSGNVFPMMLGRGCPYQVESGMRDL